MGKFQSTFPRGERRLCISIQVRAGCFNPRSHEGNDPLTNATACENGVSIHVPTRGTTLTMRNLLKDVEVSIHVPTRGTTKTVYYSVKYNRGFNPRSHEGNDDLGLNDYPIFDEFQSTFPRGERHFYCSPSVFNRDSFNPRSHEGNDF